jgi:tRNA A-37 threonylcarbamoyl transferase component Bud32
VLKYLDNDILTETIKKTLNRKELKHVCRSVPEALSVLHAENLVHTGNNLPLAFCSC